MIGRKGIVVALLNPELYAAAGSPKQLNPSSLLDLSWVGRQQCLTGQLKV